MCMYIYIENEEGSCMFDFDPLYLCEEEKKFDKAFVWLLKLKKFTKKKKKFWEARTTMRLMREIQIFLHFIYSHAATGCGRFSPPERNRQLFGCIFFLHSGIKYRIYNKISKHILKKGEREAQN